MWSSSYPCPGHSPTNPRPAASLASLIFFSVIKHGNAKSPNKIQENVGNSVKFIYKQRIFKGYVNLPEGSAQYI